MFEVDENSTAKEVRIFAATLPSYELSSVFRVLENSFDYTLPKYASKATMVDCLNSIEKEDLLYALDAILGRNECEEEDESSEDELESDHNEEDECEDEDDLEVDG